MSAAGRQRLLVLPDCSQRPALPLRVGLSHVEQRALVQGLATGGVRTLDQLVKEQAAHPGSAIATAAAAIRQARIAESRAHTPSRTAQRRRAQAIEAEHQSTLSRMQKRQDELSAALEQLRRPAAVDAGALGDDLVTLVLEPDTPVKMGMWERLRLWLRTLVVALLRPFVALWRWVRGRRSGAEPFPAGRSGRNRVLVRGIEGVERRFGEALVSSPNLRWRVEASLRSQEPGALAGLRVALRRFTDPVRYRAEAMGVLQRSVENSQQRLAQQRGAARKAVGEERRALAAELVAEQQRHASRLRSLASQLRSAREQEASEGEQAVHEEVRRLVLAELQQLGYLRTAGGQLQVTDRLIDRFADLLFEQQAAELRGRARSLARGTSVASGVYDKGRLRQVAEASRMDLVESLLQARIEDPRHPKLEEHNMFVYREVHQPQAHLVLMFDKSASMAENDRLEAAKKAVLALYRAAKRANRRNIVDLVTFDSTAEVRDLVSLWESTPGGFTNTGGALRMATELLRGSRAEQKFVYLITDGLPEAYSDGQRDRAGDLPKALAYALLQARLLASKIAPRFDLLLLEPKDEAFVDAATKIAAAANGRLVVTDPTSLSQDLLVSYVSA